jgi:hypothetical protein
VLVIDYKETITLSHNADAKNRNHTFTLPPSASPGSVCYIGVTATEARLSNGLGGNSTTFSVFAPGTKGSSSGGGIGAVVVVGVVAVVFALLFYRFYYKRSRIGGFNEI